MAALPSPTQVAGSSSAIYEAYYNVVDPKGIGTVGGMEAARFLKKSGLSDVILSKIWDLSDPGGRGCLDKAGMFVALKLVALVQNGKDLKVSDVGMDVPPPKMGDIPLPKPTKPPPPRNNTLITSIPPSAVDWTIKPIEREKYDKLFDSLQPTNGLIPGNKVKNVLMESKLPFETLGKIWDLADQDKDGMLNRHEFVVAMHLVYKALEKYAIPNTLPVELVEQVKRKSSTLIKGIDGINIKPEVPPLPVSIPTASPVPVVKKPTSIQPVVSWVVSPEEKEKSDVLFVKSDIDKDGFVSGQEIKDVFLQSGVPQPVLAHIWALCDIKQSGKLNDEQFALAMWFVARCLKGIEPPGVLSADMVPPSFRTMKPLDGLVENNNTRYSNPELDMITKDIEELSREKLALETDIAQKEADLKIKSGEIKNLQSELDTLAATLKQLENQKGEAQKRLNDLKAQKSVVDEQLETVTKQLEEKCEQVDKLRAQAAEQAEMVKAQETELNSKKEQLEGLRIEEERLEKLKAENTKKLSNLNSNLQDTQLSISQAKALITQLQEQTRQMNDAIATCDSAMESGDVSQIPEAILRIKPEFKDPEYNKLTMNSDTRKQICLTIYRRCSKLPHTNTYSIIIPALIIYMYPLQFTDKPTPKVQAQSSKGLDFTDDPFRDYRYEDPFNFTFDDEPPSNSSKDSKDPASSDFDKNKFDPFGLGGRQSVPLPSSDPFVSTCGRASAPLTSQGFSEVQQLEWAALESLRLEEDRKRRQMQEQADLDLAISLSKAESKQI
nr:epidermal growth factor receptor substrate 15-like 1 [Leptinotarsa decemlineata]